MSKLTVESENLVALAEAIRQKTGKTEKIEFPNGFETEIGEVYETGKKSEYDRFWDSFQNYGKRKEYARTFAGSGWNPETFKPKYDINVVGSAEAMFANWSNYDADITEILKQCGVKLDTSKATNFYRFTMYGSPVRLPTIDTRGAKNINGICYNSSVKTIDKLILKDDGSQTFSDVFYMSSLVEIRIEGVIGQNGFNVQWSTKLSHDSIVSIINALSSTTSGLTVTLSKVAVDKAFKTSTGLADGSTSEEWATLIATKSNWTISLA